MYVYADLILVIEMSNLKQFLCDWAMMFNYRGTNLNPHKLIKFLTDCGSMPNTYCDGALRNLCWSIPFGEEEFSLASHLISLGGPLSLTYAPYSLISKQNLKFLHSRNEECMYTCLVLSMALNAN